MVDPASARKVSDDVATHELEGLDSQIASAVRSAQFEVAQELLHRVVEIGTYAHSSVVEEKAASIILDRNAQLRRRDQ